MNEWVGVLAGIVGVMGYAPYIRDILKKATKPDRIAWLIWTLEYIALFFAQLSAGAHHSLWLIGLQVLGVVIIFGLSFRYGVGSFTWQTKVLLACVFAALGIWQVAESAAAAILLLIAVETSGVVLTMVKTFKQPESETISFWLLLGAAGLLGIPAVGLGKEAILYVYPLSLAIMSAGVVSASLLGKWKLQKIPLREDN